jgi:CubicO group peptidase (beta-lactamase class C family)
MAHVRRGDVAGIVRAVSRRGDDRVAALGTQSYGGPPMRRDTIFRITSLTKPIAAAAAMTLVDDGTLALDDDVTRWLPELADRHVLRTPASALDDVVPAARPITVLDVLTSRLGYGMVPSEGSPYPIQQAMRDAGISPGPWPPALPPDEVVRRFAALPLAHQPGDGWLYHSAFDLLAVLLARAADSSFGGLLQERLFDPLGMVDTGYRVDAARIDRVATCYRPRVGREPPRAEDDLSRVTGPPAFESGATGLMSTVDDYLRFGRMILQGGRVGPHQVLSAPSVALMTRDHLTPEQRVQARPFVGAHGGWGLGGAVVSADAPANVVPRGFGWAGGSGTTAWIDPALSLVGIVFTQHFVDAPEVGAVFSDFWRDVYGLASARA